MESRNPQNEYVAAVDLGSNSFHMVIAREQEDGNLQVVDTVRDMVRLGAGLNNRGILTEDAQERALACLERFRQRLRDIPFQRIRAVGTNTLRAAKNSQAFLSRAQYALGHPISVISGHEEARLVYLGAAFGLAVGDRRRLVIDIGGGSTELIVGQGYTHIRLDSLYMGCVSMTRQFFPDGKITPQSVDRARTHILRELEPVTGEYLQYGWDEVVGTSGTIKAIDKLSRELGMKQEWISADSLNEIQDWIMSSGHSEALAYVSEQRRPVFIGGFLILSTIFNELDIKRMEVSTGALREGVAYDLIGRLHDQDSRNLGVESLIAQFQPDTDQSERVRSLALQLFDQARPGWELYMLIDRKLITWAAQLHEIGISISYPHHHKHGAYIIANGDMDGFSRPVQRALAILVGNARQKIHLAELEWLSDGWPERLIRLIALLRLAIAFYRGRGDIEQDSINIQCRENLMTLTVPESWVGEHPLTIYDLETEKKYLSDVGIELQLVFSDA